MNYRSTDNLKEMRIDAGALKEYFQTFYPIGYLNRCRESIGYKRCRMIRKKEHIAELYPDCVYFIDLNQYIEWGLDKTKGLTWILVYATEDCEPKGENHYFFLQNRGLVVEVFTSLQELFDECLGWTGKLKSALCTNRSLYEISRIAVGFFKNPLLIHNENYMILSAPGLGAEDHGWEKVGTSGVYSVPVDLINYYKINKEYIQSLKTHGAHIFKADPSGVDILYCNIWDNMGRYRGRVCINEINAKIRYLDYTALDFFTQIVRACIVQTPINPLKNYDYNINSAVSALLHRKAYKVSAISRFLEKNEWKRHDEFRCIKLELTQGTDDVQGIASLRSHVFNRIEKCLVLYLDNSLVIIVDATNNSMKTQDLIGAVAEIVREGMYIAGISNKCFDFLDLADFYLEAQLAIDYGKANNETIWFHHFSDYSLAYMLDNACGDLKPTSVCYYGILELIKYDRQNGKDLYQVLKTYLFNEENAKKTAEDLYMHRSTLFRKLEKIEEILHKDLSDTKVRMLLQISILILDQLMKKNEDII